MQRLIIISSMAFLSPVTFFGNDGITYKTCLFWLPSMSSLYQEICTGEPPGSTYLYLILCIAWASSEFLGISSTLYLYGFEVESKHSTQQALGNKKGSIYIRSCTPFIHITLYRKVNGKSLSDLAHVLLLAYVQRLLPAFSLSFSLLAALMA